VETADVEPRRPAETRRTGTPLKALCRHRHLHAYVSFRRAYMAAAAQLGNDFAGVYPSEKTFRRWLAGELTELPRSEHCMVLEALFPGWTARQLLGLEPSPPKPAAVSDAGRSATPQHPTTHPSRLNKRESLVASAHESADFTAWAELGNIGEMTIEQIQADVRELSRTYLKVETQPCSCAPSHCATACLRCCAVARSPHKPGSCTAPPAGR
jgi:hypothetical protein